MLRLMGWRYSTTREAYVHRIGRGRRGPVFVPSGQVAPDATASVDHELAAAIHAVHRDGPRPRTETATPAGDPVAGTGPLAPEELDEGLPPVDATASEPPGTVEPLPPLARRTPKAPLVGADAPAAPAAEVDVVLDGEERTVRVDGRPPRAPGRPHLSIAPAEAPPTDVAASHSEASA